MRTPYVRVRVTRDGRRRALWRQVKTPAEAVRVAARLTDKLVRIDVRGGRHATDRGARVGDSEARIKRLYKGEYKVSRHKYVDEGRYIEVGAKGGRYLLIFETDGRRVTADRVGRPEQVGYVEGCS